MANYRINQQKKQIIFDNHCSNASLKKFFLSSDVRKMDWLPSKLRNFNTTISTFKKKTKKFYITDVPDLAIWAFLFLE